MILRQQLSRHAAIQQQRRRYFWTQRWEKMRAALLAEPSPGPGPLHFGPASHEERHEGADARDDDAFYLEED